MMYPIFAKNKEYLDSLLEAVEKEFDADVISITGVMDSDIREKLFYVIEDLKRENKSDKLYIILTTTGGDALEVERMVNIIRANYREVNFIIPDYAYSAGTIFCMSGDNIYMDYYSVLGPIDPQVVNNEGKYVPALGYIDKFNEFIEKDKNEGLTQAEFTILASQDLAELKFYEQARDLTIDLLKNWLVKYKFKDWDVTQSTKRPVTREKKEERAEEIAVKLGDYSLWKSHGRGLNIETITDIGLVIVDFSKNEAQNNKIRSYYSVLIDILRMNNFTKFIHSRRFY